MKTENYFDTEAQAIDEACRRAFADGAEFDTRELEHFIHSLGPVKYGETVRSTLLLWKYKGRTNLRRALTVVLYRLETGRYELTSYVN